MLRNLKSFKTEKKIRPKTKSNVQFDLNHVTEMLKNSFLNFALVCLHFHETRGCAGLLFSFSVLVATMAALPDGVVSFCGVPYYNDFHCYDQRPKLRSIPRSLIPSDARFLVLYKNQISSIQRSDFEGLIFVETIDLADNKISYLPAYVFAEMPSIRSVHLARNNILETHPDALTGVNFLKFGGTEHCEIHHVLRFPGTYGPCKTNARLWFVCSLHFPPLTSVPSADIDPATEDIDLRHNQITSISQSDFQGLVRVNRLQLSNNSITHLPAFVFSEMPNLRSIYLSNIATVHPDALKGLPYLRGLTMTCNALTTLSANTLPDSHNMIGYVLDCGQITTVASDAFLGQRKLISIDLSHNQITELGPRRFINQTSSFQTLYFYNNRISMIHPEAFIGAEYVQRLRLDHNELNYINPNTFTTLVNIQELNLSNNKLTGIHPNTFQGPFSKPDYEWYERNTLHLDHNSLTTLDPNTFRNAMISDLRLNNNNLASIHPDTFAPLNDTLRFLYLSFNDLKDLHPNTFSNLIRLTILFLQENEITKIHKNTFQNLPALKRLQLFKNQIESITQDHFFGIARTPTAPLEFVFGGNPTNCCDLLWLKEEQLNGAIFLGYFYNRLPCYDLPNVWQAWNNLDPNNPPAECGVMNVMLQFWVSKYIFFSEMFLESKFQRKSTARFWFIIHNEFCCPFQA